MPRPQTVVTINAELPRRGTPTPTGTAFFAHATGMGPTSAVRYTSAIDARTDLGDVPAAQWVRDALTEGAPAVVVVRGVSGRIVTDGVTTNLSSTVTSASAVFTAADIGRKITGAGIPAGATITAVGSATSITISAAATATANGVLLTLGALPDLTAAEWTAALDKFPSRFGVGQVAIPGVDTAAAHTALLAHGAAAGRAPLLDVAGAAAAVLAARTAAGAGDRAGMFTPVTVPAAANTVRTIPGSVIAAGLAARGDARVGHANHAPAGTHSGGAGVSRVAAGVPVTYTDSELDSLYDAKVNVFVAQETGGVVLQGWKSLSATPQFAQLNIGRIAMQIAAEVRALGDAYLRRQDPGSGAFYGEVDGRVRGYLLGLYGAGALFGDTPDDAYDVEVSPTNPVGELRVAMALGLSAHIERVLMGVTLHVGEGVTA